MRRPRIVTPFALAALAFLLAGSPVAAQEADQGLPTIEEKTADMEAMDGFLPMYWDASEGTVWLEIDRFDEEILHYVSLPRGVGHNDIGLNRGDLGPRHVFRFRRVGPKVLMVEENYGFRAADTDNPEETEAVEEAFARSVIWGFEVAAETGDRVLVNATDFVVRDAHGVRGALERTDQGAFSLEESRSALNLERTKNFPQNTEIDVALTFTSDDPGGLVRSVTPTPGALTVNQHHSFVQLPEPWEKRKADPRAGYGGIEYMDFTVPLGEPMEKKFIARHRLEKRNPGAETSEPVEPIVYYLDPGTPEPVRSALLDGARWWNQAFEAAGYRNAFQVRMLPDTADPMDIRYNVIQWVHRSTRGWSYGSSVSDPRTGEILKGHVTLGSLRVRQDYLIATGMLSPYEEGTESPDAMREMALARIRQLSAHEVGHTIGLSHNYISSAQREAGVQSVMDYPHPVIELEDGEVEVDDAYATEIGAWDEVAIRYGYSDFPEGTDTDEALEDILMGAEDEGITFITDQDARPPGSAHPRVHLWDNGRDVARELDRMMDVRRAALDDFGAPAVQWGQPLATMEEALVPVYLFHRYQAEAVTKVVGGLYYTYAMRGDGQEPLRRVPAGEQRAALDALMRTLDARELAIPRDVLDRLPPRPFRYGPHRELFQRWTGLVFDAVSPAAAAADHTVRFLLHPQRAARLVEQKALEPGLPGLDDVLDRLVEDTFGESYGDGYEAEVNRAVERVVAERMIGLAATAPMAQVRAVTTRSLRDLVETLENDQAGASDADAAHYAHLAEDIVRFLERPLEAEPDRELPEMPPGSPIGDPGLHPTPWPILSCPWW